MNLMGKMYASYVIFQVVGYVLKIKHFTKMNVLTNALKKCLWKINNAMIVMKVVKLAPIKNHVILAPMVLELMMTFPYVVNNNVQKDVTDVI